MNAADGVPAVRLLEVAARTDAGQKRSENQDHFVVAELTPSAGALLMRPDTGSPSAAGAARLEPGERGVLMMVADGMGGAAAGRLASGLAARFVVAELQEGWADEPEPRSELFAARIREAVERANGRIHQHALRNPECIGMGTTATVAGVLEGRLFLAQVGDSRAYLLHAGEVVQLTRDQSLVQQLVDAGAMTAEEAEQSAHGNVILQALGVEPAVTVASSERELEPGDAVLLCSDGLFRVVRPGELGRIVAAAADPASACRELIDLANDRGAPDNVTVIVARFE